MLGPGLGTSYTKMDEMGSFPQKACESFPVNHLVQSNMLVIK